ncbi:MAG TPA: hypothetical protein VK178_09555 [Opitutaceae bacterium]|nr:hypothetical protein [Opitutaceae bacterium]
MNAPTIRVRVVHPAARLAVERLHCDDIVLGSVGHTRAGAIDLLLVDAREMDAAVLAEALTRVAEWRAENAFRRAVLIWPKPALEGVVLAIRAGIVEIVSTGLPLARIVRRICAGVRAVQRRHLACRLAQLLRLGQPAAHSAGHLHELEHAAFLADEQRAAFDRQLAEREALLAQREQELRATAARVQADLARASQACAFVELAAELRAELERRETELQCMAQQTADAPQPGDDTKAAVRAEMERLLKTQQLSLDRRERALATRERWLSDYEQVLTGGRTRGVAN